jgi:predicted NUDIX family phosphoesterase
MVARAESVSNTSDLKFLTYHRPVTGGEPGLHGKVTIGYGGHIDLNDVVCDENSVIHLKDTVLTSMRREIFEELGISSEDLAGVVMGYRLITDYSNSVGRVHLGIVFIVTIKNDCVINPAALEIDYAGEFTAYDLSELSGEEISNPVVMENWSKLLVEEMNSNSKLNGTCYFHFPSFSLGGPFGDEA